MCHDVKLLECQYVALILANTFSSVHLSTPATPKFNNIAIFEQIKIYIQIATCVNVSGVTGSTAKP